jgi:hypothetical protein
MLIVSELETAGPLSAPPPEDGATINEKHTLPSSEPNGQVIAMEEATTFSPPLALVNDVGPPITVQLPTPPESIIIDSVEPVAVPETIANSLLGASSDKEDPRATSAGPSAEVAVHSMAKCLTHNHSCPTCDSFVDHIAAHVKSSPKVLTDWWWSELEV